MTPAEAAVVRQHLDNLRGVAESLAAIHEMLGRVLAVGASVLADAERQLGAGEPR